MSIRPGPRVGAVVPESARSLATGLGLAVGILLAVGAGAQVALAVGSASATVLTAIHDSKHATVTSVPVGATVHDSVRVTGLSGTPTGNVTVNLFLNDACKGTPSSSVVATLSSGAVDVTNLTSTPSAPGSISFRADYAGDKTYAAATGGCEVLTVTKANPGLTTTVHTTSHAPVTEVLVGTTVHVNATLSGSAGTPTGSLVIRRYAGGSCAGTAIYETDVTLSGGAGEGGAVSSATATTMSYRVTYGGSAVYNSKVGACAAITWKRATVELNLVAHNPDHQSTTTFPISVVAHPAGSMGGPLGAPSGGSLTISFYPAFDCSGTPLVKSVAYSSGTFDATSRGDSSATPTAHGWRISYTGDDRYDPGTSGCLALLWKARSAVTVTVHDESHVARASVGLDSVVHTSTTIDAGFGDPEGDLAIRLYTDGTCTTVLDERTTGVGETIVHDPGITFEMNVIRTVGFRVFYSGDKRYFDSRSACVQLVVTKAVPDMVTTVHDAAHAPVYSVPIGSAVHPYLDVSQSDRYPVGQASAQFFAGTDCKSVALASSGKVGLTGGDLHLTTFAQAPAAPGTYAFQMTYYGDSNYQSRVGPCATFVVLAPGATAPPTPTPGPSTPPTFAPGETFPVDPSLAPGETQVAGSLAPGASSLPGTSVAPGSSGLPPGVTGAPGASVAPGASGANPGDPGSSGTGGDPAGGPGSGSGSSNVPLPLVGLVLLIGAVVVGAAVAWRRRARSRGGR